MSVYFIEFIPLNILKKVVLMFNTKNHYFSEATFPVLIFPERERYAKTLYNLLNIGTDLDSPITLLI